MTDLRQTAQYARYLQLQNWQVKKINGTYIFIRKLLFISIIKIQRPRIYTPGESAQGEHPRGVAKRGITITKLEPLSANQIPPNFKLKKSTFLPSKTLEIDLTQSKKKILAGMKKDARYAIRKASRAERLSGECAKHSPGVLRSEKRSHDSSEVVACKNIKAFHQAWKKSIGWQRWAPSLKSLHNLKKAFGKNVLFLAAKKDSQIIAGTVILTADKKAYYYYAFTDKKGRQLLAQYLLVWQAIKWAKKQGCKVFDFEGIYDNRFPNQSWLGFTHFKKSFGGREVKYPGCFTKKSRN